MKAKVYNNSNDKEIKFMTENSIDYNDKNKTSSDVINDPFYAEENMRRLRKSIEQIETTGGTIHEVTVKE